MPTYKMIVAYDGTAYSGWQKQLRHSSIEGVLEKTFRHVFNSSAEFLGASRTDAGVHALEQIVRVRTTLAVSSDRILFALNNKLPEDIIIRKAILCDDAYSPHHNVVAKTYYYHIFIKRPIPFIARYGWYYVQPFSVELFKKALSSFIGTHNFRSFCSAEDTRTDMMRTIDDIRVEYIARFSVYRVIITGKKFLRHMIRRIVGAALAVATEKNPYTLDDLRHILISKNPHHPLSNAPSKGLMLYRITYYGDRHV